MINYNIGETYRKYRFNERHEVAPAISTFRSFDNERRVYEEREGRVAYYQVIDAVNYGHITELDKTIIGLIATFSSACVTAKVLKEMLTMMGIPFSDTMLDSSLKRLHRYHLIDFSRFACGGREPSKLRVIMLATYGSYLARGWGIEHRFNATASSSADAHALKSRAQTAQMISNYLKRQVVDSFEVRPVIVVNPEQGAIIRPAASITIQGTKLYFEVPRKRENWLEDILNKLHRYELVFEGKETPTVIINSEDEEMNKELAQAIRNKGYRLEILYTDDLLMIGEGFRRSIYDFTDNGEKRCYEFVAFENAA